MSNLTTLARPYAKAAFDLASSQGDLAGWDGALANAAALVSDATMAAWLQSPDLDRDKAVNVVAEAAQGGGEPFSRYLGVLADNDRLALLPEVHELFGQLREKAEGRLNVRVVSAIALDDDQVERMSVALARRFNCDIELHNEVDTSVVGGAVIYAGDEVIDGSVVGRLGKLQSSLA